MLRANRLTLERVIAKDHSVGRNNNMKIRLRIENRVLTATLIDNTTARDFISLLPLTLTMDDYPAEKSMVRCREHFRKGNGRTHMRSGT
jgi:hypothetical protein